MATRKTTRPRADAQLASAEKALREMRNAPALFTKHQLDKAKLRLADDDSTVLMALALLTQTGEELIDGIGRDRQFALATATVSLVLGDYLDRMTTLRDMLSAAQVRATVAIAYREDGPDIFAEAERENGGAEVSP